MLRENRPAAGALPPDPSKAIDRGNFYNLALVPGRVATNPDEPIASNRLEGSQSTQALVGDCCAN